MKDELALTLLRVFAGVTMAFAHGIGKVPPSEQFLSGVGAIGFPLPIFFAWAAALTESLGGVLIALGLFTRPAAILMSLTMAVAALLVHAKDPFQIKEMAFLYLMIFVVFAVKGGGTFALDRLLFKKK